MFNKLTNSKQAYFIGLFFENYIFILFIRKKDVISKFAKVLKKRKVELLNYVIMQLYVFN